ncbi:MAG: ATP-grasp domain-containing protein [Bacteroides sp]|nr:ATP-grasp domain-containing protein [Bacteroides sp.]
MNPNNHKIIAIVGAGEAAMPIINKAKELNIETLAFGRLDSIAKEKVTYFIEENDFDIDFMAQKCIEYNVSGIIASSEITTEATAKLAHKLGLPGNNIENGFAGRNKYLMRCKVANVKSIKQPRFELYDPNKEYSFPIVVKAPESCGKQGISLANNQKEFIDSVKLAKSCSSNGIILIEEYLKGGKEYSIECISNKDNHIIVQYTEKESSGPPHFVETAHHQPADLSKEMKERIVIAVNEVLDVLGLNCGMAHLELKIIDDEIYFIEVGARAGGDHIGDTLTLLSTDFDYFKAAIECSLGTFIPTKINNTSHSGIYFHSKWNEGLTDLFQYSSSAEWCVKNTITNDDFVCATTNVESAESGYFIYCSDHKITNKDIL